MQTGQEPSTTFSSKKIEDARKPSLRYSPGLYAAWGFHTMLPIMLYSTDNHHHHHLLHKNYPDYPAWSSLLLMSPSHSTRLKFWIHCFCQFPIALVLISPNIFAFLSSPPFRLAQCTALALPGTLDIAPTEPHVMCTAVCPYSCKPEAVGSRTHTLKKSALIVLFI